MHRLKYSLLLLAGLFLLSACDGSGSSDSTEWRPSVFYGHNAVVQNDGTVYVWGSNEFGQIGNGTNNWSQIPVGVLKFSDYSGAGVVTGSYHTMAFQKYSTVRTWGYNSDGQLGNGVSVNSLVPVTVRKGINSESLSGIVAVAAGGYFSLAVDRNGDVWSWGSNSNGQLGRDASISYQSAARVQELTRFKAAAAGGSHSLALDTDGNVWGWGCNGSGQIGDGATGIDRQFPVPVTTTATHGLIVAIAAGGSHSLALTGDGKVWAWGYNYFGQIGDGTNVDKNKPVMIPALTNISLIAAGIDHSLAYDSTNDSLYAWGYNLFGQLGNTIDSKINYPVVIADFTLKMAAGALPTTLPEITAVGSHSHARMEDGSWWSWGENLNGELGVGNYYNSSKPLKVVGL